MLSMTSNGFIDGSRTASYVPSVTSLYSWGSWDQDGWFRRADVELMDRDPRIKIGFRILCSPVMAASWKVECDNAAAKEFIKRTLTHFWQHDLIKCLNYLKYGSLGGELVYNYDRETRFWEFDKLKDFHIDDVRPLDLEGNLAGIAVYNVASDGLHREGPGTANLGDGRKKIHLYYPSSFWIANEPRFSSYYGTGRYAGAWKPWKEKRGKHGAIDVRRTWMVKNACRGAQMRFPAGSTLRDGRYISNQDVAREILEKYLSGHVMALPGGYDKDRGGFLWEFEEPRMGEDISSILKYAGVLDTEILEGLEIWPEVLQAPEVGAGWSGRAIPFLMFLGSEDQIVRAVLTAFCRQALRPLVQVNFGKETRWHVEAISLLPKTSQMAQQAKEQKDLQESGDVPEETGMLQGDGQTQVPNAVAQPTNAMPVSGGNNPGVQLAHAAQEAAGLITTDTQKAVEAAVLRFRQKMALARGA